MKQMELSKWLKWMVVIAAAVVLVLSFWVVPSLGKDAVCVNPELHYMFFPCLIFIWITAIPFYMALWKSWHICDRISKDQSFCEKNAVALKHISILAIIECILYLMGAFVLLLGNLLHPGILLIILFIQFVGVSIAILAATLSHLVKKASDMKSENDLTI